MDIALKLKRALATVAAGAALTYKAGTGVSGNTVNFTAAVGTLQSSSDTTDINGDPYSIKRIVDDKDVIGIQFLFENPLKIVTFPGDSLRARLDRKRDYFQNRTFFDRRDLKYDDAMKNELLEMTDFDSIPDIIRPRYGVLVSHTLNRVMPTNFPGWGSANGWIDQLQSTSVDFGTPVAILHASKNKDWYYVRSEISFGWIPAENVAVGTAAEIEKALKA